VASFFDVPLQSQDPVQVVTSAHHRGTPSTAIHQEVNGSHAPQTLGPPQNAWSLTVDLYITPYYHGAFPECSHLIANLHHSCDDVSFHTRCTDRDTSCDYCTGYFNILSSTASVGASCCQKSLPKRMATGWK
jgi:hypothetical protein